MSHVASEIYLNSHMKIEIILSIQHTFAGGTHSTGITHIHSFIHFLECIEHCIVELAFL